MKFNISPVMHILHTGDFMKCYDLRYNNAVVGRVTINLQGMYYNVKSRFSLENAGKFRLYAASDGKNLALSLCVPYPEGFGTECRIPAKALDWSNVDFYIVKESDHIYEPVCTNKVFTGLKDLPNARFRMINGNPVIVLNQKQS